MARTTAEAARIPDAAIVRTSLIFGFDPPDDQFAHDVVYGEDTVWPIYQQWQESDGEGVQEVIFPDDLATAEYQPPPWV